MMWRSMMCPWPRYESLSASPQQALLTHNFPALPKPPFFPTSSHILALIDKPRFFSFAKSHILASPAHYILWLHTFCLGPSCVSTLSSHFFSFALSFIPLLPSNHLNIFCEYGFLKKLFTCLSSLLIPSVCLPFFSPLLLCQLLPLHRKSSLMFPSLTDKGMLRIYVHFL